MLIMVENEKSHGSISVRYGAIIFGIGRKHAFKKIGRVHVIYASRKTASTGSTTYYLD